MATRITGPDQASRIFELAPSAVWTVYVDPWWQICHDRALQVMPSRWNLTDAGAIIRQTDVGLEVSPYPAGPWAWAESGTRPHRIPSRRRPRAPMPIQQAEAPFASGPVNHPGTIGRGEWSATLDILESTIDNFEDEVWAAAERAAGA